MRFIRTAVAKKLRLEHKRIVNTEQFIMYLINFLRSFANYLITIIEIIYRRCDIFIFLLYTIHFNICNKIKFYFLYLIKFG